MTAAIVIDIIIALILLGFVVSGVKKGFVLGLAGLVIVIVAFIGASVAADQLAPAVADKLEPMVAEKLELRAEESGEPLLQAGTSLGREDVEADQEGLLGELTEALRGLGIYESAAGSLSQTVLEKISEIGDGFRTQVVDTVSGTLARAIAYVLMFILSFVVLLIILKIIAHLLNLATKLPVLNVLNALGGGVLGLIKAMILLFAIAWVLKYIGQNLIPAEVMDQTRLFRFFMETNPVSLLKGL